MIGTDTPRVTVVVATRERASFLAAAAEAVLNQTLADIQLVIVDDAATDQTPEVCRRLSEADARVRTLRLEPRRERCAARNAGIGIANAEWIAFLDDDDLLHPDALARLFSFATQHDGSAVACRAVTFVSPDPSLTATRVLDEPAEFQVRPWLDDPPSLIVRDALFLRPLATPNAGLFSRAWLRRTGGFDERRLAAEDYDLWLRAAADGPIPVLGETLALVRWHAGQTTAALGLMARETRSVLEAVLADDPALRDRVGRRRVAARIADLAREEAYAALVAGERRVAFRAALQALCHAPGNVKSWSYLALAPWPGLYHLLRRKIRGAATPYSHLRPR